MEPLELTDVIRAIGTLEGIVKEGFAGVHRRQDTTNGRLNGHDKEIRNLQLEQAVNKGEKKAFTWVGGVVYGVVGILAGILGSLIQAGKF